MGAFHFSRSSSSSSFFFFFLEEQTNAVNGHISQVKRSHFASTCESQSTFVKDSWTLEQLRGTWLTDMFQSSKAALAKPFSNHYKSFDGHPKGFVLLELHALKKKMVC